MASKSVKAELKAAKAAVGKKEYHEVARICQVRTVPSSTAFTKFMISGNMIHSHWLQTNMQEIFAAEEGNYMGHVFAGLAAIELGRPDQAREHYKTAIAAQPGDPLAWKVNKIICNVLIPQHPNDQLCNWPAFILILHRHHKY